MPKKSRRKRTKQPDPSSSSNSNGGSNVSNGTSSVGGRPSLAQSMVAALAEPTVVIVTPADSAAAAAAFLTTSFNSNKCHHGCLLPTAQSGREIYSKGVYDFVEKINRDESEEIPFSVFIKDFLSSHSHLSPELFLSVLAYVSSEILLTIPVNYWNKNIKINAKKKAAPSPSSSSSRSPSSVHMEEEEEEEGLKQFRIRLKFQTCRFNGNAIIWTNIMIKGFTRQSDVYLMNQELSNLHDSDQGLVEFFDKHNTCNCLKPLLAGASTEETESVCAREGCGVNTGSGCKMMRCANCQLPKYCSKECQVKDWPEHKEFCRFTRNGWEKELDKVS